VNERLRVPAAAPTLRVGVSVVVGDRPKEQMVEPHARRIVAMVADNEALRDWSVRDFPCHAMGKFVGLANSEDSVSRRVPGTSPNPTPVPLGGLTGEPIGDRLRAGFTAATQRAELTTTRLIWRAGVWHERRGTTDASSDNAATSRRHFPPLSIVDGDFTTAVTAVKR
jgi:hypothetical protein